MGLSKEASHKMAAKTTANDASLPTLLSKDSLEATRHAESPKGDMLQRSLQAVPMPAKKGKEASDSPSGKTSAWKNAAKIVTNVGIWGKGSNGTSSSSQREPRVSDEECAKLCKLETLLLSDYETI